MKRWQRWLSTTGKSRRATIVILLIGCLFGLLIAVVSEKAFGVEAVQVRCASVRPESSRMACHYDHGDYGHAATQHYPRHFVRLAKRAHRRWDRHHSKVALTSAQLEMRAATWWATFTSDYDRCIAYYAARSRCPAAGVRANAKWMNHVEDIVLTCGSSSLAAFMFAGGPADPPGAATVTIGTGGACFFQSVMHWGIWG